MSTVLVTGANRGLGLAVVQALRARGDEVIATARDPARMAEPAEPLDVTDAAQAAALAARIGRLDVLVNNAGVSLDGFDAEVARRTIAVNVLGAERVTDAFLPVLADGGAVVNVSSGMGALEAFPPVLRARFLDPALDRAGLHALLEEFVAAVAANDRRSGWPRNAYVVSKAGLNALTRILARTLAPQRIRVNAVCPGWVRTRMGGRGAPRSSEEGARSILQAIDLQATGTLSRDGQPIDW